MEEPRKKGRSPAIVKSKKRSMTFPAGLYQRLEEIAQSEERPVSDLVMEAVRRFLKERESGPMELADMAA